MNFTYIFLRNSLLPALVAGLACAAPSPDFSSEIHPLLTARCTTCHSAEKALGGLALNTRAEILKGGVSGPAVIPGDSAGSLLLQRITGTKLPKMPMGAPALTAAEVQMIRDWIDGGAKGPEGAAVSKWKPLLEPRTPPVPEGWKNPIDFWLQDYRHKVGLPDPKTVSNEAFLRRAYLDIWGLLPTPQQREAFLRNPNRSALIEELLTNRKNFSENWISFWNDLLHNDEGVTYIGDRKSITKWLLAALASNTPYNQMVSTLINPPDDETSGFIAGVNWRGDINASQTPVMQAAQNSAQVFLGVNLKCNSCHDSFISSWKLKDAYGLASFFSKDPLEIARCDVKTGKFAEPAFLYPKLGSISPSASLQERRAAAAAMFTSPENGRLTRTVVNRVWQRLMGRGLVEPADDMDAEPWSPDLLDWLASDFAAHGYDINHLLRQIFTSAAYSMPAVSLPAKGKPYRFEGPGFRRLTAEEFADAVSTVSSEWRILGSTKPGPGAYARDWRFKADPLARALGRPARDLAVTERFNDPTMLQMLELVNGPSLAGVVRRGSLRLLNQLPPAPEPLYDSGVVRGEKTIAISADIRGVRELHLLILDGDSYDPTRVITGWMDAKLVGPNGPIPLSTLQPKTAATNGTVSIKGEQKHASIGTGIPSELVYDIAGRGFTRFEALGGVDESSLPNDINPRVRYYVFGSAPDRKQMTRVQGEPPVARTQSSPTDPEALIRMLFEQAFSREPTQGEQQIAMEFLSQPKKAEGLEDLLWSIFLTPEFQYIR